MSRVSKLMISPLLSVFEIVSKSEHGRARSSLSHGRIDVCDSISCGWNMQRVFGIITVVIIIIIIIGFSLLFANYSTYVF